jgi:hypothetical protein
MPLAEGHAVTSLTRHPHPIGAGWNFVIAQTRYMSEIEDLDLPILKPRDR